jgi:hypothetical protein
VVHVNQISIKSPRFTRGKKVFLFLPPPNQPVSQERLIAYALERSKYKGIFIMRSLLGIYGWLPFLPTFVFLTLEFSCMTYQTQSTQRRGIQFSRLGAATTYCKCLHMLMSNILRSYFFLKKKKKSAYLEVTSPTSTDGDTLNRP